MALAVSIAQRLSSGTAQVLTAARELAESDTVLATQAIERTLYALPL